MPARYLRGEPDEAEAPLLLNAISALQCRYITRLLRQSTAYGRWSKWREGRENGGAVVSEISALRSRASDSFSSHETSSICGVRHGAISLLRLLSRRERESETSRLTNVGKRERELIIKPSREGLILAPILLPSNNVHCRACKLRASRANSAKSLLSREAEAPDDRQTRIIDCRAESPSTILLLRNYR